eukprot:scaffold40353_cov39-Tisochrysis_lutea.AAC.2
MKLNTVQVQFFCHPPPSCEFYDLLCTSYTTLGPPISPGLNLEEGRTRCTRRNGLDNDCFAPGLLKPTTEICRAMKIDEKENM